MRSMMALRWLLQSACNVAGHPHEENMMINQDNGVVKGRIKVSNNKRGLQSKGGTICDDHRHVDDMYPCGFQMPLHYPRYTKTDYEKMEEWKVDLLLRQYGMIGVKGTLQEKRAFAMGAFLWPDQYY